MEALFDEHWDVIVVGTGMGGATVGHALAAQGRKLLFIERGCDLLGASAPPAKVKGTAVPQASAERLAQGLWPTPLRGDTNRGRINGFPSLGCGTGGTTLLYAAQLERLFPTDFEPRANFSDSVDESTVPVAWPIRYAELLPHYDEAERLYHVCGTADPLATNEAAGLRKPPPLSPRDHHFIDSFRELGLRAYQAHVACDFVEGCVGCGGCICTAGCKADARRICLAPAIASHGARLLSECEVLAVDADQDRVHAVRVRWRGEERRIEAAMVILAAGALMTPCILLQSRCAIWPDGLANRSGLVGRNLMFHASDFAAVQPVRPLGGHGPQKAVTINDFYQHGGEKLGTFQSIGITLNAGIVAAGLVEHFAQRGPPFLRRMLRVLCRLSAFGLAWRLRGATLFATVTEDLPYRDNRVLLDEAAPNGMRFEYTYRAELRRRSKSLRRKLSRALTTRHRVFWLRARHNLNIGHPCGTCRFGDDPATSVLDRDNRAHGIDNLYVVDASFFPSSGGTNPSLTIAANALRVARAIDGRRPATPAVNGGGSWPTATR